MVDNLFKKLKNLGKLILIPQDLLTGMQELRLLGNDAAHIEAQTFDDIGKEEIEVSLDFAKEILKAVYQYESLLQRLKNLKRKETNDQAFLQKDTTKDEYIGIREREKPSS